MNALTRLLPTRADYAPAARGGWRADALAGVTVGIVALPLALAFGVTSGLGASAGIITAIVAGAVAAVFGGSDVQVSGPTGAMTVVLVPLVAHYGRAAVLIVGVIAGIFLIALAAFRSGRALAFIPWPVIEGFTLGIAIIIFLQQVPAALGVAKPHGENAALVAGKAAWRAAQDLNVASIAIMGLVILIMMIVPRVGRALPASLIGVGAATLAARAMDLHIARIGTLPSSLPAPRMPSIGLTDVGSLLGPAFAIAALAAIESLLSAKVADGMADGRDHDPDRELFGQGLANVASAVFGGMPATGAIARTAVNVRAGARTRLASIMHAGVLLLVVMFFGSLVREIPIAALAGVLIVTAVRMVDIDAVRTLLRATRSDALVLILTTLATVVFDLVVAVEMGVAVACVLALRAVARSSTFAREELRSDGVTPDDERALLDQHIVVYRLDGALFFGASARFLDELMNVADVKVVIFRLSQLQVLDATGAHALAGIIEHLEGRGVTVLLKGARAGHRGLLDRVGVLKDADAHVFDALEPAVAHARLHALRTGALGTS